MAIFIYLFLRFTYMHVLYFCGSFVKGEGGFLNGREKNDT